ncbi:Glycoside hydrolase, family 31 [Niveomyces insectorum RCEF 264]|uniref:Glycoside hydrolase, family 31 n=1 Tax=Niveomyces insectorum RCEF 264 TaxID=1081102 RepID=A0A167Q9Q0_9HYPO|nr:Glycoside hydrolase, family 31 [Niveomyces insectorum RCEF 264]
MLSKPKRGIRCHRLAWAVLTAAVFHGVAISAKPAVVPPAMPLENTKVTETSGSTFLGADFDQEYGVFSMSFAHDASAGGARDRTRAGPSIINNTLSLGQQAQTGPVRHRRHASPPSSRAKLRPRGSVTTADGGRIQWGHVAHDAVTVYTTAGTTATATTGAEADAADAPITASFAFPPGDRLYGVWEYPWNGSITNNHYGSTSDGNSSSSSSSSGGRPTADIGLYGTLPGINWSNARAPFFFSKSGFGVYVDSPALGTFDFQQQDGLDGPTTVSFSIAAADLTYSVLYNTNLTALLARFASLSSYPLLPAEAGYGPIVWSDDFEQDFHGSGVRNAQDNINDVADHLEQNRIRATAFFADRPYGSGNSSFGNFDFDPKFYPSPAAFIANLTRRGYGFQVWAANRAFLDTRLYNDSVSRHWLFPGVNPTQFLGPALNLSIPAAYDYFRDKLTAFVKATGIGGFKIDRGEEHEMPDAVQNTQQSLFVRLCAEVMEDAGAEKTTAAATKAHNTPPSYYNFARSAFDRDRTRVAVWNGDSQATFTGLQYSVASGIRAGLLGFSHWGSDTGGYIRDAGGPTEELFARWMHFSAWSPMYEIMVGLNHTPWYDYTPRLVGVLRQTAATHARLVPFLRSHAYQATRTGLPVLRALFLTFPADDAAYDTADAYTLGSEFLVAPLVAAGGRRTVRFPQQDQNGHGLGLGPRFLEYENKTAVFAPGATHEVVDLPLESTPVYVREGAIVPTGDVYQGNAGAWSAAAAAAAAGNTTTTTTGNSTSSFAPWRPALMLELFPSYDVPQTIFTYYRGSESAAPGPAAITMTTDKGRRTITLAADDLGAQTRAVIYHKANATGQTLAQTFDLPAGRVLSIQGLISLFE